MRLDFVKMHGLGNDFMLIDARDDAGIPSRAQWRSLSDRHTGVGFDQALVLLPPRRAESDIYYRVFNADGSEAEQCGNGVRCIAALLHERRAGRDGVLTLDGPAGSLQARVLPNGDVMAEIGRPNFDPPSLPFDAPERRTSYEVRIDGERYEFGAVSLGNPHAVLRVASVEDAAVERIGRALQSSALFPRQVNVGFMQLIDQAHIRVRVFERGAGETQACGTGACAAVVVGRDLGLLGSDVEVRVRGGALSVHWDGAGHAVWMTGPARKAFEGHVEL
jgi:diaminopimelate epimerase